MSIVYLNGEYLDADEARVPVLDRGFIFGDGIYEVVPTFGGRPLRLEHHLQRLENSLKAIRLDNPHSTSEWAELLSELLARNGDGDMSVYLQITRGVAQRDHALPNGTKPTVFAMCNPLKGAPAEWLEKGIAAVSLDDSRWLHCNIKATSLLPNVLLRQEALDSGAQEAILVRDGYVTEGAASNVFVIIGGLIVTPPADHRLLPGITRDLVLELARENGIPCTENTISVGELAAADEIWLTSSTREVLAVTKLDGKAVGKGEPGPLWRRIFDLYQDYKARMRQGD